MRWRLPGPQLGADSEVPGELGLGAGGKRSCFLVANMNPFDFGLVMHGVDDAVQGIADHAVDPAHARVSKRVNNVFSDSGHNACLPFFSGLPRALRVTDVDALAGSPVAAFSTSPPPSRAISARS